jgi:hypothetical protein
MSRNPITSTLTLEDARRAIYIDFESRKGGDPVLLGACYAEGRKKPDPRRVVLRQDVIEPAHSRLAGALDWSWPGHMYRYDSDGRSLRASLGDLVGRARNQDRLIVSWSQHELGVIESADLGPSLFADFRDRYRDGKATASRWLTQAGLEAFVQPSEALETTHQLAKYFDLVGFWVPEAFGVGRTGENLKRVSKALKRGGFDEFTERQQQAWEEVLGHNLYDCFGLREVCLRAAADLEVAGAAA